MNLAYSGQFGVNKAGASSEIDTRLTQPCSLDVLAHHLARLRPTVEPEKRLLVSLLREQIKRFDANPEVLRPSILETIDAIEGAAINADKR